MSVQGKAVDFQRKKSKGQLYLFEFPFLFANVYILSHLGSVNNNMVLIFSLDN